MSMATIAIDEDEFRRLLNERDRLREQVQELQVRGTELVQECRDCTNEISRMRSVHVVKPITIEDVRSAMADVCEQAANTFLSSLGKATS